MLLKARGHLETDPAGPQPGFAPSTATSYSSYGLIQPSFSSLLSGSIDFRFYLIGMRVEVYFA